MENDRQALALPDGAHTVIAKLVGLDEIVPQYVNIIHATNDQQVFQVVFSQVMPPLITGPEDAKMLLDRGTVPAQVVARLIFTPALIEQAIDVFQTQLARYREQQDVVAPETQDGEDV